MSKLMQKFIAASDPGKSLTKPELQKLAKELGVEFEKDNNKSTLAALINADLKEKAGADGADESSADAPETTSEDSAEEEEEDAPPPPKPGSIEESVAKTTEIATGGQGLKSIQQLSQALDDAGIKHEMIPSSNPRQTSVYVTVGKKTVRVPDEGDNFTVDL